MPETANIARPDPGPLEPWRRSLANSQALRQVILTRTPQARDGADLLECNRDRAAVASLFPDEQHTRDAAVCEAAAAGLSAALSQIHDDGFVVIEDHRFPAGSTALTPGLWISAWGLALTARNHQAIEVLCDPRTIDACQPPAGRGDPFWQAVFSALAELVLRPSTYAELAEHARGQIARATERIVEPGHMEHLVEPLLAAGETVARTDQDGYERVIGEAVQKHAAWFAAEQRRFDRSGFLAFPILGVASLAHDRGLETHVESAYLPLDLVRGEFDRSAPAVFYDYPVRRISGADEANWFLDLEGFPRAGRTHVTGGSQVAYRVGWARAVFENSPESTAPPALDGDGLVRASELLARRAGIESMPLPERRAWLEEAADAVEEAIRRLPRDGRSERLEAVAQTYRKRIAEWDREREAASRAGAYAAMDLIRAQVEPILRAVASDRTEEAARLLRPQPDDYPRVFVGRAVEVARRVYEPMWHGKLDLVYPDRAQSDLLTFIAPAGMLATENEVSWQFPGGYQSVAPWLQPQRVWVAWKFVRPGQTSGLAYDGLVWCDDHWAWFPKPFRALRELAT